MRGDEERFAALANVVLIGQGRPEYAVDFCSRREVPWPCTVAPGNEAYREFDLERGSLLAVSGPKQVLRGARHIFDREMHQGKPRGDVMQLPGTFVIDTSGVVRYAHRNREASDNPPNEEVLAVLETLRNGG